jgi:hypothetical protein
MGVAGVALCLLVQTGAARAEGNEAPATAPLAVVAPGVRGTLALEPGRIRAGDVATVEIVVTTPPGHRVHPVAPPAELPGFWILDAEALPVEQEDGRWIHRTRVRLRARELGQYVWPAQPVEIEAPDGAVQRLVLDGRPLEVVSVLPEFPGRSVPFGLRDPAGSAPSARSAWSAAAAGALAGASGVCLVALARRARRKRHEHLPEATRRSRPISPWQEALARIEAVRAGLDAEPGAAIDTLAHVLRCYVTERYRRDVTALTTPELAALVPPPEATRSWPELVALLRSLDDARFSPGAVPAPERASRARDDLSRVRAFVDATTPPGARS